MLADETSVIAPSSACFLPEARSVRGVANRQFLSCHNLLRSQVGHRNFRRRNQKEVLGRQVEHIIFELRKLTRSRHGFSVYHKWRKDLSVFLLFRVKIQHEVDESSLKSGAEAFIYRESGACDFAGSFEVQNVQRLTDIPVSFRFEVEASRLSHFSDFHIVRIIAAFRYFRVWRVRHAQQCVSEFLLDLCDFAVHFFNLIGEFFHLGKERGSVLALFLELRNLARCCILFVLQSFDFRKNGAALLVELFHTVQAEISLPSSFNCGLYAVKIFSDSFDI